MRRKGIYITRPRLGDGIGEEDKVVDRKHLSRRESGVCPVCGRAPGRRSGLSHIDPSPLQLIVDHRAVMSLSTMTLAMAAVR